MEDETIRRTWDGQLLSSDPPYGASAVVFWRSPTLILLLHRAHHGPDWAWTPPSGARQPGESMDAAAVRELREEAGLTRPIRAIRSGADDRASYLGEIGADDRVHLVDPEHDRVEWVSPNDALARIAPEVVRAPLACALAEIAPS